VIFVVNGAGVAVLRELSPLMTAIVFAGRTGVAFAAQIGTQKVNEEINAIVRFGLDPLRFLVRPRLLAAALVVPLLTVMAAVAGRIGGALVMLDFDVGFALSYDQLLGAVGIADLSIGLVKALAFGVTIAAIGAAPGYFTRPPPSRSQIQTSERGHDECRAGHFGFGVTRVLVKYPG
jgi:phospholipid/cholesterol/gamma-HCH transport system permease protein